MKLVMYFGIKKIERKDEQLIVISETSMKYEINHKSNSDINPNNYLLRKIIIGNEVSHGLTRKDEVEDEIKEFKMKYRDIEIWR